MTGQRSNLFFFFGCVSHGIHYTIAQYSKLKGPSENGILNEPVFWPSVSISKRVYGDRWRRHFQFERIVGNAE
jgi:hypothetical protein